MELREKSKRRGLKYAFLVYQLGIAEVFQVRCLNLATYGRMAKRLWQGDYTACINICRGLGYAGVVVRTAHCESAGDVTNMKWEGGKGEMFPDARIEVTLN